MFSFFQKHKSQIITAISILFVCTLFLLPTTALAADSPFWAGIDPACISKGDCKPCDVVQMIANVGKFIMGIVGGITLLFFLYGGWLWLISGGNKDKIGKGKQIFVNSTIGLFIVLFAYVLISGIVFFLSGGSFGDWSKIC